jgi:5-methylcytosine-specific restriction endonuclease McrA
MITTIKKSYSALSNDELVIRLDILVRKEREITLKLLLHLNEIDRRRLYLERGYGSLFEYCTRYLGYSESVANRRIQTARCIRDYPEVYAMLDNNELNMTVISKIAGVLTAENKDKLLREVRSRSSRQVEMIVARYHPRSVIRDRVRPVFLKTFVSGMAGAGGGSSESGHKDQTKQAESDGLSSRPVSSLVASWVKFTTGAGGKLFTTASDKKDPAQVLEKKYKLEFAVSPKVMAKVKQVKALLSNKYPRGVELEYLMDVLLDEYLDKHSPERKQERREKRTANKKQSVSKSKTISQSSAQPVNLDAKARNRHIPATVQDQVYTRDNGRCSFVSPDGTRCNSSWNLQIDHIVPYARGGGHTIDNLRLLCAKHNRLEAERIYGRDFMARQLLHRKPLRE